MESGRIDLRIYATSTMKRISTLFSKSQTPVALESSTAPSDAVWQEILAFRTITTLLSQIPRARPLDSVVYSKESFEPSTRLELRISAAFACITVIEHDVVAITSHRASHAGETQLRLVVCANKASTNDKLSSSPSTPLDALKFAFARNFRHKDNKPHPEQLSITYPEPPLDLNDRDAHKYIVDFLKVWGEPLTLSNHLWILSQILTVPKNMPVKDYTSKLEVYFSPYIISMCRNKMHHRLSNPLSVSFYSSLKQVELQDIPIISQVDALDINPRDRLNDYSVIMDSVMHYNKDDAPIKAKIPNLIKIAENGIPLTDNNFVLYTNETSQEFHQLLIFLLDTFQEGLKQIVETEATSREEQKKGEKAFMGLERDDMSMLIAVRNAGYALLRISRGHAIKMHLANIAPMLQVRINRPVTKIYKEDEYVDDDDELNDIWSSLETPKPGQETGILHPYIDWLRLIVGHIDATDILTQHISTDMFRYSSIDIDMLVAPKTDGEMLPWRELFKDTRYISENSINSVSGTVIQKDLEDRLCLLSLTQPMKDLQTLCQSPKFKYKEFSQVLLLFIESTHPGISALAFDLKKFMKKPNNRLLHKQKIIDDVGKMKGYFKEPHAADHFIFSLDKPNVFKGTVHCEAFLASVLPVYMTEALAATDARYGAQLTSACKALEHYGDTRIIGVSKRCCPVCDNFLKKLGLNFIVRGAHSTISPCSLPLWTSLSVAKSMNEVFGQILKDDIKTLLATSGEGKRRRSDSTSSASLSIDSRHPTTVRTVYLDVKDIDALY